MRFDRNVLLALCVTSAAAAPFTAQAQVIPPGERAKFTREQSAYRRYTTPMQCLMATEREIISVWRAPRLVDTASYQTALVIDTVPTSSIQAGQQCLNELRIVTLRDEQRVTVAQLALRAKRDSVADTVLRALIQTRLAVLSGVAWDWILNRVADVYESARPIGAEGLRTLILQMESDDSLRLGLAQGVRERLRSHLLAMGNFSAAAGQSRTLIQLHEQRWGQGLQSELDQQVAMMVYFWRFHGDTDLAQGMTAAQPVVAEMRTRVAAIGLNPEDPFGEIQASGQGNYMIGLINQRYVFSDSLFGRGLQVGVPAIHSDLWVRRSDTLQRPVTGRVTLFVGAMHLLLGTSDLRIVEGMSVLRRLHDRYAARGLEIVYPMQSRGYFRDSPVLSFEQERDALANALFDYYRAPGIMALERAEFSIRPDGKRIPQPTPNQNRFSALGLQSGGLVGRTVLVDRHGKLMTTMNGLELDQINEASLVRLIERALNDGKNVANGP